MSLFKKKIKDKTEVNLWELIPVRKFDFEKSESELVTILIPKFTNKFLVQHLMPRLKYPFIKIKLDEIGSAVWLEIDGKKKVGEIAEILEQKFGDKIQPIEDRLSKFFTQLKLHRFIDFKKEEK
jgi:hypothetical protein